MSNNSSSLMIAVISRLLAIKAWERFFPIWFCDFLFNLKVFWVERFIYQDLKKKCMHWKQLCHHSFVTVASLLWRILLRREIFKTATCLFSCIKTFEFQIVKTWNKPLIDKKGIMKMDVSHHVKTILHHKQ